MAIVALKGKDQSYLSNWWLLLVLDELSNDHLESCENTFSNKWGTTTRQVLGHLDLPLSEISVQAQHSSGRVELPGRNAD
jgi:hypothetical protein